MLRYSSHTLTHQSTISKLRRWYRDAYDFKDRQKVWDHVSPQTGWIQFAWWLWGIVTSLHVAYRCAIMAGGYLYRPSGTGYVLPNWNPGKLPRSLPNSWSNNWVYWWPVTVLPVGCGALLAVRDFGKFLMDPTSLIWAISFVVIMILEHNNRHMIGNWCTHTMVQSAYL